MAPATNVTTNLVSLNRTYRPWLTAFSMRQSAPGMEILPLEQFAVLVGRCLLASAAGPVVRRITSPILRRTFDYESAHPTRVTMAPQTLPDANIPFALGKAFRSELRENV